MNKAREAVFAGQFYSSEKKSLLLELKKCFSTCSEPKACKNKGKILAAVSPHAGYMYSGSTAAFTYKAVAEDKTPETIVIIGPNHSGYGPAVSVFPKGVWSTPLGEVEVNAKISEKIHDEKFILDETAHAYEHSIEVQLPFLQFVYKKFKIVPICVMDQSLETMADLGKKLAESLNPEKDLVIASTDFSHYVPYDIAYENDFKAIDSIKKLDEELLYKNINAFNISMCGYGCVAAAFIYAKKVGAREGKLLKYQTSGDITGDKTAVVGYGSLVLTE